MAQLLISVVSGERVVVPTGTNEQCHFSIYFSILRDFTKPAKATGPENTGPERPLPGLPAPGAVLSPSRITPENNGKIRPQPDRENGFARASGGDEGIRTLETVSRLHP